MKESLKELKERKDIYICIYMNKQKIKKGRKKQSTVRRKRCSVSIVTRLRAGRQEFDSREGNEGISFLFVTGSIPPLGRTQPHIQWVPGDLLLGAKRPGLEPVHLYPSTAEVKNACSYTSTPSYVFIAWYLVRHEMSS
jgi:hypothetical protein